MCVTRLNDGTFVEVNAPFCELVGWSRDELIGRSAETFEIFGGGQDSTDLKRQLRNHGELCHREQPFKTRDGSHRDALHYLEVVTYGDERYVLSQVIDITDRKQMEVSLQRSERALRTIFDNTRQSFVVLDRERRIVAYNRIANERSNLLVGHDLQEGARFDDYIAPEARDAILQNIGRALQGEHHVSHRELADRHGHRAWYEAHYDPIRSDAGEVTGVFFSVLDISQRRRAQEGMDRRLRELTSVHWVSQRLQTLQSLESLAESVIRILEETLNYEYCGVLLVDDDRRLRPFVFGRWQEDPHIWTETEFGEAFSGLRVGRGIVGRVAETGESICSGYVEADPRYDPILPGVQSELCVPLMVEGRILGVINAETRRPHAYTDADRRVLEIVATQIAAAIQNAQLFDEVARARDQVSTLSKKLLRAQETERRSIATELHDEIGQSLTALKMLLETEVPGGAAGANADPTERARSLINDLIGQVRRMSLDLRPAMLDDLGLWPTLEWHVERFQADTGIQIGLSGQGLSGRRLPSEVETTTYRIIQEALTNVARHAQADDVAVALSLDASGLLIEVRDHGVGFDARTTLAKRSSTGLVGMRERVELLGGQLDIDSAPGAGTRLEVRLPLDPTFNEQDREVALDPHRHRG